MCFFFFLLFLLSIPDHIATDGLRVQSNVAKHVQRRVCVRLRSKTWTVGVYYKGWFKMQRESASRCSRCWPDGSREEAFEWQKWNIDKTRGHKHTARLKMWPDGWHLISQCLLVSSFFSEEADFLLLISTLDVSTLRLREHPSNPPPPPRAAATHTTLLRHGPDSSVRKKISHLPSLKPSAAFTVFSPFFITGKTYSSVCLNGFVVTGYLVSH